MAEELRAKLTQLKELVDHGLLTEEEFQAQKAALLAAAMGTTPVPSAAPLAGRTAVGSGAEASSDPGGGELSGATKVNPSRGLPDQVGNYRILGVIGAGGMGTVVRARHLEEGWARRQGGDVALKLIHPQIAEEPSFRERFLDEAQLGRRVQHAALASVYDVVVEGPWLGTVMELVEGQSLASLVVPGGLPLSETLDILRPLAAALDYLHSQNIVHRDLKPANVKVRPDGMPVILDLGIAKDLKSSSGHTRTMTTMGTTAWMAPEQADAKHVGPAADRYALGLIAYALLSGQMPWGDELSEMRIVSNKMTGKLESLSSVRPEVPPGVAVVVMAMLSVDPSSRLDNSEGFVTAIQAGAGEPPLNAPVPACSAQTGELRDANLGRLLLYASWRDDCPDLAGWSREQVCSVLLDLESRRPMWEEWALEVRRLSEKRLRAERMRKLQDENEQQKEAEAQRLASAAT